MLNVTFSFTLISFQVKKYRDKFDPRVTAKYDIKALIGRGSFSRVVRVENRMTRQPYAIKMIDRVQGKEVFESELAVLRRVKHPYIIQLVEVFETKDKVYMVMELATGGELFDRIIAKGSFVERDATRVLNMVLEGVNYLHGLGITHRDLKPENLLYYHPGHDSKIMITDFGLSATIRGENMMRTTCGTPEYIAPEILARKPYTCQVDMWAVGVVTYILLSGTMPFDDENRTRLYRLILKAKYNYIGEVNIRQGNVFFVCVNHLFLFVLWSYVPVNNVSVMVGRSHCLVYTLVSCSGAQISTSGVPVTARSVVCCCELEHVPRDLRTLRIVIGS